MKKLNLNIILKDYNNNPIQKLDENKKPTGKYEYLYDTVSTILLKKQSKKNQLSIYEIAKDIRENKEVVLLEENFKIIKKEITTCERLIIPNNILGQILMAFNKAEDVKKDNKDKNKK